MPHPIHHHYLLLQSMLILELLESLDICLLGVFLAQALLYCIFPRVVLVLGLFPC
jgi:hypothetical protein